ncbi:hypothetical protein D8B26_007474 [Coccidioides posadasii str. Silveira]|uniref:uncharacterized protein n=1 Tax=Coccidioides posadasii (strain RMSCC 757 / Silveira) TaxID=443226 RepID=UPI001BF07612|nr:hypothetical protein D8B26_007474 [Coccidioides posadasii str. Silveira]
MPFEPVVAGCLPNDEFVFFQTVPEIRAHAKIRYRGRGGSPYDRAKDTTFSIGSPKPSRALMNMPTNCFPLPPFCRTPATTRPALSSLFSHISKTCSFIALGSFF